MEEFKPLPKEYKVTGYLYEQVKRGQKSVMYHCKEIDSYEVFLITKKPATVVFNKPVPAREVVPSQSNFGQWAWCLSSTERAEKLFAELESGERGQVDDE